MTKLELKEALEEMDLDVGTFSFFSVMDEETEETVDSPDTNFGTCDISGEKGDVADCVVLDSHGDIISLQVGTWLISGHLGRMAGAF